MTREACKDSALESRVARFWDRRKSRGKGGDEAYASIQFRRGEHKNPLRLDDHVAAFPKLGRLSAGSHMGRDGGPAY